MYTHADRFEKLHRFRFERVVKHGISFIYHQVSHVWEEQATWRTHVKFKTLQSGALYIWRDKKRS